MVKPIPINFMNELSLLDTIVIPGSKASKGNWKNLIQYPKPGCVVERGGGIITPEFSSHIAHGLSFCV